MAQVSDGMLADGRYRLDEPLGHGGVGTVFRGYDSLLQRQVAIKEVRLPYGAVGADGGSVRARVMREARAAARIGHPSVVSIFDVVEGDDRLYLVMELVDGESLASRVHRAGRLDPAEAARIALPVLDALAAAHEVGVVHRDVKPSNILIGEDGRARLADFGIASVADDGRLTATGIVLGSPSYMAPEQATGKDVVPATDLWGLGATLYYSLEACEPFARETTMATLAAVVHEEPPPASHAGTLAPLLTALLRKDAAARPQPAEVRRALEAAIVPAVEPRTPTTPMPALPAKVPSVRRAAPTPAVRTAPRQARRWPTLVAALVVALLVGGAVAFALTRDDGGAGGGDGAAATTTTVAAPPSAAAPDDWTSYTDEATGFQVRYPPGWEVSRDATRTDFRDPESGTYLRVDWTESPGDDAAQAWRDLAVSFASTHSGYEEIGIEPTTFRDLPAATWEFTYTVGNTRLHAIDLGMIAGRYGFALYFQTRDDRWGADRPLFDQLADTFELPPA